jgi:hypothetical protein
MYAETDQCAVYYFDGDTAIICDDKRGRERDRASADRVHILESACVCCKNSAADEEY